MNLMIICEKKMLGGMKDIVTVNAKDMRAARTGTGSNGNEFLNTSNIVRVLATEVASFL